MAEKGSATQRHINSFQKGSLQGIDDAQVSNQTYLDSVNGRVIYNEDGNFAWENAKGTLLSIDLMPLLNHGQGVTGVAQYILIGQVPVNGKIVLFFSNGTNSEIGVFKEDRFILDLIEILI